MKKMIQYQRYILLCMLMLCCGVSVYGGGTYYYSKAVAKVASASTGRGTVYVTDPGKESSSASENSGIIYNEKDNPDHTYQFKVGSTTVGYTFDGWYENETGGSKITSGLDGSTLSYKITSDQTDGSKTPTTKTLYARWNPKNYDVTLNANGGSGSNQTVQATYDAAMPTTLKAGGAITTPTKTNYTFDGYFDAQTDGTKYYNSDLTSAHTWNYASNKTLYAHWTATYYGRAESNANPSAGGGTYISCNGNTPKKDSDYKTFDYSNRSYSNQASQPSCPAYYEAKQYDGYKFNGWYTGKNGTGTLKSSNLSYTEYFTLTAVTEATRTTIVRYAYFVPVTVNSVNPSSTSVTFTKPETKSVTLTFNVSNADATADFNTPSISNTTDWSLTSWSYANNQVTVVVSMTVTGNVTSSGAHNTTVTLTSKGTSDNQSKSATINATVNMNPVFTCAISDHYMVDAAALNLNTLWTSTSNGTKSYKIVSFTPSSANNSGLVSAPTITNGQLSLGQAGTVELKLEQVATTGYNSGEATKTITIHKYNSTFSQVSNLATTVGGTATSNYTLTYVKPNAEYVETTAPAAAGTPGLGSTSGNFYYTLGHKVTTDKQTGCPNEYKTVAITYAADNRTATGRNQGVDTVHLYQKETYKYTSANTSFTVAVSKLPNTIYVKGNKNYSSSIYVDSYDNELTLTADNTDYTNCPITNKQTAGTDIATFYQNDKVVYSSYKLGTATWSVTQPENYKYKAGNGSFTVNVIQANEGACRTLLNDPTERTFNSMNDNTYVLDYAPHVGDTVYFDMKKLTSITTNNDPQLQGYNPSTGKWEKIADLSFSTSWTSYKYAINNDNYTKIKWYSWAENGSKSVRNVRVIRRVYLNVGTDNSGINGTLTVDKKSDGFSPINPSQTGEKNTTIYWSCAGGGDLKIVCDNPHFSFSQNEITGVDCNKGTTDVTVFYTNTEAVTETATVIVYNNVYRRTFTVKGVIEKADQNITWNNDILRVGQSYTDVATANTLVTYESSDESIIRVDEDGEGHKTILTAVGTGTVNITATAEESSFYAEKSDTKSIKVTEKQIQWIDWNQSLFGLKLGGANVTMNAVAASDVEGCESSRLIEYSSSNESVVKVVNNNQLQIIGVGTAIITAVQAGGFDTDGHEYERAETEKTVIVRDPNAPCESYAYQQGQEVRMDCGWNALDKQTRTSEINFNGIIPATGTLRYKGEYRKVAINYFDGTMTVEQYIPGENWQPVTGGDLGKPSIGTYKTANLTFDRRATKMRVKVTDGLGYHYFTDCQVTQARFIETTAPVDFNLNVGQQQNQVIYLSYSNITDGLSLTLAQGANSHFSVDKPFIEGSCGSAAKNVALTITYHPTAEETNAQDVLTITDGTTSCKVVLTGSATRVNRHINWDHADKTDIYTVQTETLSAEARTDLNELAGVVTFSLASSSTATGAISMENVLSFTSAGVANVVAYTTDDARYNAAPNVTKVFNVSKTPTTISTLPVLAAVTSGTAVGDVELTGWQVTNTFNGGVVEGTLAITSADLINVGTNTVTLSFTPDNTDMYVGCTSTTTIVVNKATSVATPSAANIVYGQTVNESELSNEGTAGTWSWTDARAEDVLDAGTYNDLAVHFKPTSGNYTEQDATVTLTVEKANPEVTAQASAITYGQAISASSLTTKTGNVDGSWSWAVDATQVLSVGNHDLKANFSSNDANYNNLSNVDVTLTVNKIETQNVDVPLSFCAGGSETFHGRTYTEAGSDVIEATGATRDTVYNVTVTVLQPTVGADSKTITVGAEESWNGINLSGYAVGEHSVVAVLTNAAGCDSTVTLTLTVNPLINEFTNATGDGDWNDASNWTSGVVPTESAPDVVVSGELVIDGEVTVGDLTIQPTGGVTIVDDGKLTVTGQSNDIPEYGDIHVTDDGALELKSTAVLEVRNFTLDAKLGDNTEANPAASGQVEGKEKLNVNGNVYFQMTFDPSGNITYGWYDFVVPFEVEVLNGVYDEHLNKLTYGVDYLVMNYNEQKRAVKGKDWNEYKGTMQPGRIYTIAFEETKTWNTFIFKKKAGSNTWSDGSFAAEYSNVGQTSDRGWNGLGNGTLQHRELSGLAEGTLVQMYNHTLNCYEPFEAEEKAYAVGTAFFLQVDGNVSSIDLSATDGTKELRAPKRDAETTDKFRLVLAAENSQYTDRLWFSADEEATETYVIGHDVLKMGTLTSAKKAQMWSTKGGKNLCDVEATLNGSTATTPLSIYAPTAGNYELTVEKAPENSMLYLTYNGRAIWNLTYSPYVFDLTKGTTEGYGLKMYVMQVATDIEQSGFSDQSSVRKVLIDDVIYIVTPEGKMYDITGKSANY